MRRAGRRARHRGRGPSRPDTSGRASTPASRARPGAPRGGRRDLAVVEDDGRRSRQASISGSKAASSTMGFDGAVCIGSSASGIPAARSFWSAPLAAPASRACCQTLAASPRAAASSASSVIGGQPVAVAAGEIAGLAVQVLDGLDDQAQFPQIVLVPLEHPVEGVVGTGFQIGLDGLAQLALAERPPCPEQTQRQVHQPLGLGNRHRCLTPSVWCATTVDRTAPGVRAKARAHARRHGPSLRSGPSLGTDRGVPQTATRSQTKISVSPGAMAPPAPRSP